MVQRSRIIKIILEVGVRVVLLVAVFFIGLFSSTPAYNFIESTGYQPSDGFFGSSWGNWELAWVLASVFWGGIIFGFLGKNIDYIFFALLFVFAVWEYLYPPTMPSQVYVGLVATAIISFLIGFGLKLVRQRFFGSKV